MDRAKNALPVPGPFILFYLMLGIAAYFRCLILGQTFFDNELLQSVSIFWPFLKNAFARGILPLWNPYLYAGQPFWADPNTSCQYPILYPLLAFSIHRTLGFFLFFHLFLSMLGTHFWMEKMGLSDAASSFTALAFAFCGLFTLEIVHPTVFAAVTWLPWLMACLEAFAQTGDTRWARNAGLALSLLTLAGNPQIFLGAFYLGFFYLFTRLWTWRKVPTPSHVLGRVIKSAVFFLWGFTPGLLSWIPFYDFARFSDRLLLKPDYESFTGLSMAPAEWFRFLFPLRPEDPVLKVLRPVQTFFQTEAYLGLWVPFFAVVSLFSPGQKPFKLSCAFFAIFFFMIGFGGHFPLHPWLFTHVLGFGLLRGPFRFIFIFQVLVCLLAGMGMQHWIKSDTASVDLKKSLGITAYLSALLVGAWYFHWNEPLLLGLATAAGMGLLAVGLLPKRPRLGLGLFSAAVVAGFILGGWDFRSSRLGFQDALDFKKMEPFYSRVSRAIGSSRFFQGDHIPFPIEAECGNIREDLPADTPCLFGLKNAGGNNPLSLLARGQLYTTPFRTFLRLMAIQGFTTGNEKGRIPGFERFQWDKVKFYESKEEMHLVYSPVRWKTELDPAKCLKIMQGRNYTPYELSLLSEYPSPEEGILRERTNRLKEADLVFEDLNSQEFDIRLDAPGLVVFSETNFPGWKAWADHKPLRIFTANYLFRGLFLPQGDHQVIFKYRPTCFALALFLCLVWVASVASVGLNVLRRSFISGRKH